MEKSIGTKPDEYGECDNSKHNSWIFATAKKCERVYCHDRKTIFSFPNTDV